VKIVMRLKSFNSKISQRQGKIAKRK